MRDITPGEMLALREMLTMETTGLLSGAGITLTVNRRANCKKWHQTRQR